MVFVIYCTCRCRGVEEMRKDVYSFDIVGKYTVIVERIGTMWQVDVRVGATERNVWGCLVERAEYARELGLERANRLDTESER